MGQVNVAHAAARSHSRRPVWPFVLGGLLLAIVALVLLWDWNWFRPLVERQASAAIGRKVIVGNLGVHLGLHPTVTLSDVEVANPDGFTASPYLAHIDRLVVAADAMAYVRRRQIVLPRIEVDRPDANIIRLPDGTTNYALNLGGSSSGGPSPQIGEVRISGGHVHFVDSKLKSDFQLTVATEQGDRAGDKPGGEGAAAGAGSTPGRIVATADGTYAGQPIKGQAISGALLSLRDASSPYPVEMHLENGPIKLDVLGTVQDPLHFKGGNVTLHASGPDMSLLSPLSGFPLPSTPNFDLAGMIDYADHKIRLHDFQGKVGSSDLGGAIAVDPTGPRPVVDMDLASKHIDLADLGGLVGSQPGRVTTPGQTSQQKQQIAKVEASPQFLPTKKISVPQIKAADFHIRYKGDSIVGRGVPFDSIATTVDVEDGTIHVHPASLGVGRGTITASVTLTPVSDDHFHLNSDVKFDRVDVGRMLNATGAAKGAGLLGGRAELVSTGNSISTLVTGGDGSVRLMMAGGNLSALIIDLSGLEFGNALLSALGLPNRTQLQCFIADLSLRGGKLDTKTMLAVTSEADVTVTGNLDLLREALNYRLRTEARHFSVGSLPADIGIGGTLKSPRIMPNLAELGARTGAAVALGVLLTPLGALLPTVQFGSGDENARACAAAVQANGKTLTPASAATPPEPKKAPAKKPASTKKKHL